MIEAESIPDSNDHNPQSAVGFPDSKLHVEVGTTEPFGNKTWFREGSEYTSLSECERQANSASSLELKEVIGYQFGPCGLAYFGKIPGSTRAAARRAVVHAKWQTRLGVLLVSE